MPLRLVLALWLPGRQHPVRSDDNIGSTMQYWPPAKHCPRNKGSLAADAIEDAWQDNDNDVSIED